MYPVHRLSSMTVLPIEISVPIQATNRAYGNFYTDYLKVGVYSIRKFIGGAIYTKIGLCKLFPCINETSDPTKHKLRNFIELVGLPYYLHSDNHGNLK